MEHAPWWLKSCPKCGGDVYLDNTPGFKRKACLQCGWDNNGSFRPPVELMLKGGGRPTANGIATADKLDLYQRRYRA